MKNMITFDKSSRALNLMDRLYKMRKYEKHCDFVIKVGSARILAHRNVLRASSDYFDRMLYHDTIENSSGVVEMKDVDADCVRICIDFMYGKQRKISEEKYEDLMYVANLMQLNELSDIVANIIGQNLNVELFFMVKRIADMYGCQKLQSTCQKFANENFPSISLLDDFVDLDKNYITEIIKLKNVRSSVEDKLEAAVRWVKHDVEARCESLAHFLELVNLRFIPIEKRQQLVHKDPLIKDNKACVRILCSSIINSLKFKKKGVQTNAFVAFDKISGHLWQYKPKSNSWEKMYSMLILSCSAVASGDYIYIFIKDKEVFRLKYTDKEAKWERMADMIEDHGSRPPVVVDGELMYVMGGGNYGTEKCVERFDPGRNKWTKLPGTPQTSCDSALLALRGFIYSFGGWGIQADKVFRFDPTTSEWKEMKPIREERRDKVSAVELCERAYVASGFNGRLYLSGAVDCYDPEKDQWTVFAHMMFPLNFFKAIAVNNSLYVFGGRSGSRNTIDRCDVEKSVWTTVEMPSGTRLKILEAVAVTLE